MAPVPLLHWLSWPFPRQFPCALLLSRTPPSTTCSSTIRDGSCATNWSRLTPSPCHKGQECNHESHDGNYRARNAQVRSFPSAHDGIDGFSAGAVDRSG